MAEFNENVSINGTLTLFKIDGSPFEVTSFEGFPNAGVHITTVGGSGTPHIWASAAGASIQGDSLRGMGVHGVNDAPQGSSLKPDLGCGVWGESTNGYGVYGSSDNGSGVKGRSVNGKAGEFIGHVEVSGTLTVNGTDILNMINQLMDQISLLKQQLSTIGMTREGVSVSAPTFRPILNAQIISAKTIQVTGIGFSTAQVNLVTIRNGAENIQQTVTLPWQLFNSDGGEFMFRATDNPARVDDNDTTEKLWSNTTSPIRI